MQEKLHTASGLIEQKKYPEAIQILTSLLESNPDHPSALFMYAIAQGNMGEVAIAERILKDLVSANPNNSELAYNLALFYQHNQIYDKAIENYIKTLQLNPQHVMATTNLAFVYQATKDINRSINLFYKAWQLAPNHTGLLFNYLKALYDNQNYIKLLQILQPIDKDKLSPEINKLKINALLARSDYLNAYTYAENCAVNNPSLLFFQGLAALKLCWYVKAEQVFQRFKEYHPDDRPGQMNHILALIHLGKDDDALNYLKQFSQQLKTVDEVHFCVRAYDLLNNTKGLQECILAGLDKHPDDVFLRLQEANLHVKQKHFKQAKDILIQIQSCNNSRFNFYTDQLFQLAQIEDKLENYASAWSYLNEAHKLSVSDSSDFNQQLKKQTQWLKNNRPIKIHASQESQPYKQIFIVGFPRSGTTLTDSILNTYKNTLILEELPILDHIAQQFGLYNDKLYLQNVIELDEATKDEIKTNYFSQVHHCINWNGTDILINKSPLNILHIPLIHSLFPDSPIVFCTRHPLDSILSCYMQNFNTHPQLSANFSDLNSIVDTYNHLLDFWKTSTTVLNIPYIYIQYELLVNNFENESHKLTDFCKLKWDESLINFHQSKPRGAISNPSSQQVNKPLYRDSVLRHTNYLTYLSLQRKALGEWIDYFNYK